MSSARGSGAPRGRGRGSTQPGARGRERGASTTRGRVFNNVASQRINPTGGARSGFGAGARGQTGQAGRGPNNTRGHTLTPAASPRASFGGAKTGGSWQERYQKLTKARDRERVDAIRTGLVADPDKPRNLSDAITPVGTCQEMCAEFERVQRVVQDDVWAEEKDADGQPDESRMVKKFRRAAAGLEEQLPSDLRSPEVLKRTCDYLFEEVIGNASALAQVHHFVWDRTRAIRNDFSIQQLTKLEELRIAVECYERIARFHILSLHQLASPQRPYAKYDWSQEREQLDRTLLSLIQYYEDTRGRLELPNEAEFRAYCVIFQLRSPTPDLEDTVQTWPRQILKDKRLRRALDVYAAGCTAMGLEGPLMPKASHLVARQDWQRFWTLVASNETSYLMGCVSEVYFNSIRRMVLNALFRTFRASTTKPTPDCTLDFLREILAFDDDEEVQTYCKFFGFEFKLSDEGQMYLELSSVAGRTLPQPNAGMPNQLKSLLVEDKRLGRTLSAVINGMTVQQAQNAGQVLEDEERDEGMEDIDEQAMTADADQASADDEDSLFIPEEKPKAAQTTGTTFGAPAFRADQPNKSAPSAWGQPSGATKSPFSTAAAGTRDTKPAFDFLGGAAKSATGDAPSKPAFDFLGASKKTEETSSPSAPKFNFLQAAEPSTESTQASKPAFSFPAAAPAPKSAPKFNFLGGSTETSSDTDNSSVTKERAQSASNHEDKNSKPAEETPTGAGLFKFASPAPPKPTSPSQIQASSAQTPSAPTFSSPTSQAAPVASPFSPSNAQPNPFLQPPPKSPAVTPTETAPSFSGQQTKQAQPHFTAPAADSSPSHPNKSPSSSLNAGLRRPSTSTDTRPKKPSPLSHSFTATEQSSASAHAQPDASAKASAIEDAVDKPASTLQQLQQSRPQISTAPVEEGGLKKPTPFKRPWRPSEEDVEAFDKTVDRIAKEFVADPINGLLKQYVEYKASQIITSIQEEIATERAKERLSELRISTLRRKYVKRWIGIIWQRRLAKSGKDRRQRRRRRLEEGFDDGSSYAGGSVRDSQPGSVLGGSSWQDHQENVDAMFQRTINSRALAHSNPEDGQARPGSKRPTSSRGESDMAPKASSHKRLKSTSHVDERGRVSKPTTHNNTHDDTLKRSSVLGFSVNGPLAPSRNTTHSNYFRLKAMGVHRADQLSAPRGSKRSRTESEQASESPPPQLRKTVSTASSPEGSPARSLMAPPSSTVSRAQKAKEEDDALFARLRAARESLTVGAVYMRSEIERDEENRRSLGASHSSNESPSMVQARTDARARASQAGSPDRDVPAYRLRESKFVPREHYGRAIERSRQMRESRSRESSRPATRAESRASQSIMTTNDAAAGSGSSVSAFDNNHQHLRNGMDHAELQDADFLSVPEPPKGASAERSGVFASVGKNPGSSASNPMENHQPMLVTGPAADFDSQDTVTPKPAFGTSGVFGVSGQFGKPAQFDSTPSSGTPPLAAGNQSAFGSLSAASSNPFSAFESAQKSGFGGPSTFPPFGPQDQTIQPEHIDQSLANSFGSQHDAQRDLQEPLGANLIPLQQNSYLQTQNSQAISLLSDDEEEEELTAPADLHPTSNGLGGANASEELIDEASDEDDYPAPQMGFSRFEMLADADELDQNRAESQGSDDEAYDQDEYDEDAQHFGNDFSDQNEHSDDGEVGFDDQYYGGDEDGEEMDGDADEETDMDDGAAEDEFDEEEDEDEDDEDAERHEGLPPPPQPWQKVDYPDPWRAKPVPNPAMQGMGKTEDAPIELDSD